MDKLHLKERKPLSSALYQRNLSQRGVFVAQSCSLPCNIYCLVQLCQITIGINYNALQCLVCVKRVEFADDANFCSMLSLHCAPYFQNLNMGSMLKMPSDHLDACMMHDPDTCLYARCMNPWCGRNFVTNKPTDKAILIQGFWLDLEPSRQNQILPAQPTSLTYLPPDPPKTWPPYTPDLYLPTWSSHQTYPLILSTWHFYLIYPPAITFGKGQFRNFGDVYPVCIIGVHDVSSVGGRD